MKNSKNSLLVCNHNKLNKMHELTVCIHFKKRYYIYVVCSLWYCSLFKHMLIDVHPTYFVLLKVFMHLNVYFDVKRSMIQDTSSPPNMKLVPPYAECVTKVITDTLTHVHRRSKQRLCNPFVDDKVEEGNEDVSKYISL